MANASPEPIFGEYPATLIKEHRGMYLMINAVSRRVRQLQRDQDRPRAYPPDHSTDKVRIAVQEFIEDKLDIVLKVHSDKFAMEMDPSLD